MKRREFITLVGGATAWPVVARAQQAVYIVRANRRQQRSKFSRHNELLPSYGFRPPDGFSDVAVISLSRPITSIRPVVLSGNVPAALAHGVWMQPHGPRKDWFQNADKLSIAAGQCIVEVFLPFGSLTP